jgi:hypothetical protein
MKKSSYVEYKPTIMVVALIHVIGSARPRTVTGGATMLNDPVATHGHIS